MKFKKIVAIVLFLMPFCLYGQDKIYFDSNWKKVKSLKFAKYYRVITIDPTDTLRTNYQNYFLSGTLKSEYHLVKIPDGEGKTKYVADGKLKKWFENGKLQRENVFAVGKIVGPNLAYWENGQLRRQENYSNDKFVSGKSYNQEGKEIEYSPVDVMPEFPGGETALMEYISKNLKYPEEMQKMGIQGKSVVYFVVMKDGSIGNIEILRSATKGLDEEAIRVIKSLPTWKPGLLDGEPVSVFYTLPVNFNLKP